MKTKTVMMPRELTEENGAKAAMVGKFSVYVLTECPCLEQSNLICELCGGNGTYKQPTKVPWETIKKIYTAAVEHLGC